MAYLHCHNCDWSQDDFWSPENWNPVKHLASYKKEFFVDDFDEVVDMDWKWLERHNLKSVTRRELMMMELDHIKATVRNMVYRTQDELKKKNPEKRCPKCGEQRLDID